MSESGNFSEGIPVNLQMALIAVYMYSGPVLIAAVFTVITYHVVRDWCERRRTEPGATAHAASDVDEAQDRATG